MSHHCSLSALAVGDSAPGQGRDLLHELPAIWQSDDLHAAVLLIDPSDPAQMQGPQPLGVEMPNYTVWYMRPSFFRDGMMGYDWLKERNALPGKYVLGLTHIELKKEEATGLENLWIKMQGENWSPNGEARGLIEQKKLQHTSMSVGDIAVDEEGRPWIVDRFGFKELV